MGGGEGPARLGDDVGHGNLLGAADGSDGVDHVVGVLPHRVVHAGRTGGARPLVVHSETAANIHMGQIEAHAAELGVVSADLLQAGLHETDIGDLAAEMEVHQLEDV